MNYFPVDPVPASDRINNSNISDFCGCDLTTGRGKNAHEVDKFGINCCRPEQRKHIRTPILIFDYEIYIRPGTANIITALKGQDIVDIFKANSR